MEYARTLAVLDDGLLPYSPSDTLGWGVRQAWRRPAFPWWESERGRAEGIIMNEQRREQPGSQPLSGRGQLLIRSITTPTFRLSPTPDNGHSETRQALPPVDKTDLFIATGPGLTMPSAPGPLWLARGLADSRAKLLGEGHVYRVELIELVEIERIKGEQIGLSCPAVPLP